MNPRESAVRESDEVLAEGRYLRFVVRDGWEFAERKGISGIIGIVAVTDEQKLLLVEQNRPPVRGRVLELPAGLVGDIAGEDDETLIEGACRELREETGYEAACWNVLTQGPLSPGTVSEVMTLMHATGLVKVEPGGGGEGEEIRVHEMPLASAERWLAEREAEGLLVDVKVYTGLYFALLPRQEAASCVGTGTPESQPES